MAYFTPTAWHSYQTFPSSPVELEDFEPLSLAELQVLAEADGFEKYSTLIPFNTWDYVSGEEPEDRYYAALAILARADDFAKYDTDNSGGNDLDQLVYELTAMNAVRCGLFNCGFFYA